MYINRLACVCDGVLNRAAGGSTPQDIRNRYAVEVWIVRFLNLDPEA